MPGFKKGSYRGRGFMPQFHLKLIRESDNSIVKPGDTIQDFRGEDWVYIAASSPSKIIVARHAESREFLPSVFNTRLEA